VCPESTLFDAGPIVLKGGVQYYPNFIGSGEADGLFTALQKLEWRRNDLFSLNAPRQYVWMGLPGRAPQFRKIVITGWTPEATRIKALVEEKTGRTFDSLILNLYRDHQDSIDWHFDGEEEGLWSFPIASVSLGAARKFKWRSKKDGSTTTQALAHGSLLVMPPGFQSDHLRAVLKQTKACGPRINLTFRRVGAP
jgi:alkylated DNA repair dioxygenase AlkB